MSYVPMLPARRPPRHAAERTLGRNDDGRNTAPKRALITVIGQDKTGVIARVTNCLFEGGANIESLEEQVTRGQFSMVLQASWTRGRLDVETLKISLGTLSESLGMEIRIRVIEPHRRERMALMVTREPDCLEAVLTRCQSGWLKTVPAVIIANRRDLEPVARKYEIPFAFIPWEDRQPAEVEALRMLDQHEADFVVLARFMKVLSPNFVWRYPKKIINMHPSLLPSFPGAQAYRQAWERGVKIAGVTAHFVTMNLDEGPIIAQDSFPIRSDMRLIDLIKIGQKAEAKVLVKAVRSYLAKSLEVSWGVVHQV
jgi:formyltetrahydrofolate deformylase